MKFISAVLALVFLSAPALAADSVSIPWGDWLAGVMGYFSEIIIASILALVSLALRGLPAQVRDILLALRVEQVIARGLDYGLGAVAGAVKGRVLEIKVANEVLNDAARYVTVNAPELAGALGGTLRPKILARMSAAGMLSDTANSGALEAILPAPKA